MDRIPSLMIDSSHCITDLCGLGGTFGTDKSPLHKTGHRHPYTAVYSLLFSTLRFKAVRIAEIGIFEGASLAMWSEFFPRAEIFGYDSDPRWLMHVEKMGLPRVHCRAMDICVPKSIVTALREAGGDFDIILEDTTHYLEDQIRVIRASLPFLTPGGILVIEDVCRDAPDELISEQIQDLFPQIAFATYILTEHVHRFSGECNNDKLLILVKT